MEQKTGPINRYMINLFLAKLPRVHNKDKKSLGRLYIYVKTIEMEFLSNTKNKNQGKMV
jgi:hypothetical protein